MERYLKFTITVDADLTGRGTVYERGTPASELPKEVVESIPDHKWVTQSDFDGTEDSDIEVVPFDEMGYDQLAEIAKREGIDIGRMKSPDRIRDLLRSEGVGVVVEAP